MYTFQANNSGKESNIKLPMSLFSHLTATEIPYWPGVNLTSNNIYMKF